MKKERKLIIKMSRQPNGMRWQEIAKILEYIGYSHEGTTGDHMQFRRKRSPIFTLVKNNPVLSYQVRELEKIIKEDEKNEKKY